MIVNYLKLWFVSEKWNYIEWSDEVLDSVIFVNYLNCDFQCCMEVFLSSRLLQCNKKWIFFWKHAAVFDAFMIVNFLK